MGLNYTLNKCLELVDTEYVARMDGDDISLPYRFEKEIKFLIEHSEYSIVSTNMYYFDENGIWGISKVIEKPTKEDFIKGTPFCHAPCMVKTEAYKTVKGYTVEGIDIAEGEYIGFVDSDDWIDANMYERLLEEARKTNAEVVMCDATTIFLSGKTQADTITQLSTNQILKKSDFMPALLLEMAGSAWRCIYKNNRYNDKLMQSESLHFPLGVKFSEDRIFNIYAFGYANKICYIKESYYNRYMNEKSAVHRFHEDYFEAYKKAAEEIEKAIDLAWNAEEKYKIAYLQQFISGSLMAICNYYYKTSTMDKNSRKQAVIKVCDDIRLQNSVRNVGAINIQTKWLIKKRVNMLILYAKLANWKHGR